MKRRGLGLLAVVLYAPLLMAQQAPGQIRPRPAEGRQPELPPPTIREYKPRSMLVTPQHPVPRAKFPVIDIHSHQPTPISVAVEVICSVPLASTPGVSRAHVKATRVERNQMSSPPERRVG